MRSKYEYTNESATLGCYYLGSTLGKGAFGKVKVAFCGSTNKEFAIKIFKKDQENFNTSLLHKEVQALKLAKHTNVPMFIESYESVSYVKKNGQQYEVAAIVMEYVQNGALFDFLVAPKRGFPEEVTRTLFRSLIETLQSIHNQKIVHRDLKIENLLLDKDFSLKIGDFGFASKIEDERGLVLLKGRYGTPSYMAPEVWSGGYYHGAAVDIFACGVILFKLLTACAPFEDAWKDEDGLYDAIADKDYDFFWDIMEEITYKTFSVEFKDFVNWMLALDPNERPSIEDIRGHAWMNGPVLDSEDMKEYMNSLKKNAETIRFNKRQKEKKEAFFRKNMRKPKVQRTPSCLQSLSQEVILGSEYFGCQRYHYCKVSN